ncbi:MAG: ABC transporter permease, partial [Verrucomicrobiia bacterium]
MRKLLQPVLAVAFGLVLGLGVTRLAGENPWHVLQILWKSAFGSRYDFGMTLFYSTPLIFTGLAVAVPFQAGLFNIGAEGQLTLGALAAAAVGAVWPGLPWPLAPVLAILAAVTAGTVWGAIPGWLRAKRGSHEVINTIMLNFIAAGLASYVTLYLLKNPDTQNPETRPIGAGYLISQFGVFGGAPVSMALPLAIVAAVLVWILMWRTVIGFEMRAVGQNESAARAAGINTGRMTIVALAVAGGLAGLVGVG